MSHEFVGEGRERRESFAALKLRVRFLDLDLFQAFKLK